MRQIETKISNALLSRPATVAMMVIALLGALVAHGRVEMHEYLADAGFAFPSPNEWLPQPTVKFLAGIALTAIVCVEMEMLNRIFNLLRTTTILFLGLFAVMEFATPMLVGSVISGLLLNVIVLGVLATYYTCYQSPRQTKRVFLSMCIMSALSLCDYVYAIYIALFVLGFNQMRCNNPRMWLATFMGLVTPWWLAWGFSLSPGGFHWPDGVSIFGEMDKEHLIMTIVTVGITIVGQFLLCASNMLKVYSYNARSRSMSGLLMMLSLATALAALFDFGNALAYLTLLNCFTAFQMAQCVHINSHRRGYLLVVVTILIYAAIYFCNLWILS